MTCSVCPAPMFLFLGGLPYCEPDWRARLPRKPKIMPRVVSAPRPRAPRERKPYISQATHCNPYRHGREPHPIDVEALRRDYPTMGMHALCAKYHTERKRIYAMLGVEPRRVGARFTVVPRDEAAIRRRIEEGASFRAIVREFHVSHGRAKRIAHELQEANAKKADGPKDGGKAVGHLGVRKLHQLPALEVRQFGVRVPEMRGGCGL